MCQKRSQPHGSDLAMSVQDWEELGTGVLHEVFYVAQLWGYSRPCPCAPGGPRAGGARRR